jgi:hypothetical protein
MSEVDFPLFAAATEILISTLDVWERRWFGKRSRGSSPRRRCVVRDLSLSSPCFLYLRPWVFARWSPEALKTLSSTSEPACTPNCFVRVTPES